MKVYVVKVEEDDGATRCHLKRRQVNCQISSYGCRLKWTPLEDLRKCLVLVRLVCIHYHGLFWRKLEEFIRKTLEKREKTEETNGNQ